jgi:hypothetical protein
MGDSHQKQSTKSNQDKSGKDEKKTKPWHRRNQPTELKRKDPEAIPVLKYGPSNNFTKFRDALSKAALKEFGPIGKLIKQEKLEMPEEPDRAEYNFADPDGLDRAIYLEELKKYNRRLEEYEKNAPKLFWLILQYLSDESLEAVKKDEGWDDIEAEADPEGLWKLVVQKHKVHSASEVGKIVKLSARQLYKTMRQGDFESIISYKERFNSALAAYKDQGNLKMADEDIALDFFSGLDNARYADFKADFLNGLTSQSIKAPKDLNTIYVLASQWVKPKGVGGGTGTTFATTLDEVKMPCKDTKHRKNGKDKKDGGVNDNQKKGDGTPKKPVKCFNCEGDHYVRDCPELKRNKANNADTNMAAATFEATTFVTYQVNTVSYSGFMMKPGLLHHIEPAKEEVNICGVGGLQLHVKETGYLNEFFRVYASEDMKANVLSFADVEDLYDVTYVRGESFVVHLPSRDLEFVRRGKLYVADFAKEGLVHATRVVTKGEEARAKKVYELVKNLGFPSMYEVIQIVESGSVGNMPLLTGDDVRHAYELYGPPVGFVRGKTTRRQACFAVPDDDLILDQKK